jgi:hypothetical protein
VLLLFDPLGLLLADSYWPFYEDLHSHYWSYCLLPMFCSLSIIEPSTIIIVHKIFALP